MVLALNLARAGVSFRLIERASSAALGSRAKGVQPRTLEIFDQLGIVDEILANGQMDLPICSVDMDGQESRSGGDAPASIPGMPYPASVTVPLFRVEAALRRRIESLGGRVDFGVELTDFSETEDAIVATVQETERRGTVRARWLVGCDGGHSIVRKRVGIAFEGSTFQSARMIIADVHVEGLERDCWRLWRHADGFVGLCPLPSTDLFQFQASTRGTQDSTLSLANMQAIVDRRSSGSKIRLAGLAWSSLWRANIRLADHYRVGRVLIAGDAAHVHAPSGGQGTNTGIQDAHNLGWKLAAVLDGGPERLVDSYEVERRPIAADVIALSKLLSRESLATRGITIARDERTWELKIGYRGSPIVGDDREDQASLRAGDRTPDAGGLRTPSGACRLFDLLRHEDFTLIAFGEQTLPNALPREPRWLKRRAIRVVETLSQPGDVVDAAGELRAQFSALNETLVLVRPDGYIAAISDHGPADLLQYLAA